MKIVKNKTINMPQLFKGSIDHFGQVDLFVDLTLLNIIAVHSLSLSIIIFKIKTKNSKISLKLQI